MYGLISVVAAWLSHTKKMIAPLVFKDYTDSKLFNSWLKKCLVPELKQGQIIIMDNASFHKSPETKRLSIRLQAFVSTTMYPRFKPNRTIMDSFEAKIS